MDQSLDETPFKRSMLWKLYFVFITALSLFGMYDTFTLEGVGYPEYISLITLIIATNGLFGFVFGKPFINAKFWAIFSVLYLIFGLLYLEITDVDLLYDIPKEQHSIVWGIGWFVSIPGYLGLFLYGFSSKQIWANHA